jgi:hypothetical protein
LWGSMMQPGCPKWTWFAQQARSGALGMGRGRLL